ncbi:DUF1045 domain-containing protein [Microvirga sp. VF16]|uniref:DUF1045 domain-containing protein n=1 Tax=Microvirga sp. VF16 TaxID=2807101 RepID=UPI00193E8CE3|nr:DUF1045 domain-containing protein [Microvirga sp. VF16]QRM32580.1 DUF1045 domain-containing protein [Microvirga sp. VF16]
MPEPSTPRYAIYYTPAREHPLTVAAAWWLGRDAFGRSGMAEDAQPEADRLLIAEPRRYGFHATLKAPFRPRPGTSRPELAEALRRFAESQPPCPIGPLRVAVLGSFVALVPRAASPVLQDFAAQVVSDFDAFRAPLTEAEWHRRRQSGLDATETGYLEQWGYPYVFDRFRFHLTLTGPVPEAARDGVARRLEALFAPLLDEDFLLDALTLFEQDHPAGEFTATARFALSVPLQEAAQA